LRADLETERTGDGVVIVDGLALNPERALAVFSADPKAGLINGRENKQPFAC